MAALLQVLLHASVDGRLVVSVANAVNVGTWKGSEVARRRFPDLRSNGQHLLCA